MTGQDWKTLVPKKVYEYIMCYHLDERMIAYQQYLEEQTLFEAVEQLEEEEAYREEMEYFTELEQDRSERTETEEPSEEEVNPCEFGAEVPEKEDV